MSINPIIFQDEGGIGVQVGEEKAYIGDDIIQIMNADYNALLSRVRSIDADNVALRERITKSKEMEMKYNIIVDLVGRDGY